MQRRNFLKSLVAALALAPVLARFRMEPVVQERLTQVKLDAIHEMLMRESGRLSITIANRIGKSSMWIDMIAAGPFPQNMGNA